MNPFTPTTTGSASANSDVAPPSGDVDVAEAELLARFFRVLGDPTRVRLVHLLLEAPTGECTVGELVTALSAPQSRVSTHLGCLRWCGLVHSRREGKQVYYRVADPRVRELLTVGGAMLHDYAAGVATCGVIR
jgi:ArsR family transcriptional regulator, cadmium/lead-responsive transcriptional repressor